MAGYSDTPLMKKLGIKENFAVGVVNSPANLPQLLGDLPANASLESRLKKGMNVILIFVTQERVLRRVFRGAKDKIVGNGMIWVAWPKKSSKMTTDLTFDVVQQLGLDEGLVDVKICAIDDVWSGLKFVYRLKDR